MSQSPPSGFCQWGTTSGSYPSQARSDPAYTYSNDGGYSGTLYTALISGLRPGVRYYYQCGFPTMLTPEYNFAAPTAAGPVPTTFVAFGDMGTKAEDVAGRDPTHTQQGLANDVAAGSAVGATFVLSVGDMSYADDHLLPNAWVTTEYWNEIQKFAANAPLVLCPGNHEVQFDFASHLNYTRMPQSPKTAPGAKLSRFYTSFDIGAVHFLTYSTETPHPIDVGSEQYDFIRRDLASVNRSVTPWIVVFTHHPMYCSSLIYSLSRCGYEGQAYRAALEPLFLEYQVDVHFAGHDHQYERSYPLANGSYTSSYSGPYSGVVYIVNGAAGGPEAIDPSWVPFTEWVGFHDDGFDDGYARVHADANTLTVAYVHSKNGEVVDSFTISRS